MHRDEFADYLESHADLVIGKNVFPQLIDRVAAEKRDGYHHVIATASYRLYVDAIAHQLDFDTVIATDLASDDSGHVLARIDGHNCYDVAKMDKVRQWMAAAGIERDKCHIRGYSDHVSDAPLLEFADEAFATNPHLPLRKLAHEKGWKIIDWR